MGENKEVKSVKVVNCGPEMFSTFYEKSAFTLLGLTSKDDTLYNQLSDLLELDEHNTIYKYTGKDMNDYFHLTGRNRYPDDLVVITIDDYYNVTIKLLLGARWFDDIVDNNQIMELYNVQEVEDEE